MATINLLNYGWQTQKDTSAIEIDINSERVKFYMDTSANTSGYAKACIAIDASKYSTITLQYSSRSNDYITDFRFGVYDNMTPSSASGKIAINGSQWNSDGGSASLDISDLTGTKYVGFWFYGNESGSTYGVTERVYITSLTATERGYTLTYNANGGSGAPNSVSNITSATISSTVPTRDGYDFLGWSTSSSATSASYVAGNTMSLSSNTTLYAVWQKFYTVTYDANGGSDAPSPDTKIDGQTIIVGYTLPTPPANTSITYTVTLDATGGTCDPDKVTVTNVVTYEFVDWNTKSDGSGTSYQFGDPYSDDSDMTLYAQYSSTTTSNSTILPTPSRSGYDFLGWSTNEKDTSGIIGEYTPTDDITLYATWKRRGLVHICDSPGTFNLYEVFIYDGSGCSLYVPYIYTESGWIEYSG